MATLVAPIVGRDAELAALAAVTGLPTTGIAAHTEEAPVAPCEPAPPLVVVYGGVSTGKSRCVLHALRGAADHFAFVDCTGVMATRAFYNEVLGQLQSNARGRRPRRASSGATAVHEDALADEDEEEDGDDEDVVTITDAPPEAKGSAQGNGHGQPQKRRKRQSHEERKDSEDDDSLEDDEDEDGSDDSDDEEDVRSTKSKVKKQPAAAKATHSATKQSQHDGAVDGGEGGPDPAHSSLNFLSFVKALRNHMEDVAPPEATVVVGPKPTVYIALDHVEALLGRGFDKLVTCLLAVNDQLDYLHVFDTNGAPWRLCVILIARAVSVNLDLFLHSTHPAFVHFPAYTKEDIAAIVTQNLLRAADASVVLDDNRERAAWLRKWLVGIYDLMPHCHDDWLEFQHVIVQMLPSFHEFFDLVSRDEHAPLPQLQVRGDGGPAHEGSNRSWVQLQRASRERVATLEMVRRRHLFGYDTVGTVATSSGGTAATAPVSSGDPVAFIAGSKLSSSCQLLLLASYLASFTPHEADVHFVSSSGGLKRKRRVHVATGGANGAPGGGGGDGNGKAGGRKANSAAAAARKALDQQLVGPKIFELPRLLAIYHSLQSEHDALVDDPTEAVRPGRHDGDPSTRTRADIFTHLSLLVRLRLLQRASPASDLDQPLFRCIADTRLVHEIARRLQIQLNSYLTTRG